MRAVENIANKAIELINEQIAEGKDIEGNSYRYSDKPFFMPYNKKLAAKFGKKSGAFAVVKRGESLGMIIKGGYLSIRKIKGREENGDFLQDTGAMLKSLGVIKSDTASATIGFRDSLQASKAFWLSYSGAGKSRKAWKFFGLSQENEKRLADYGGNQFTISANLELESL